MQTAGRSAEPAPPLRAVAKLDTVWIPLSDGIRLAATVWLPQDAEDDPVPAVLEYIPYRRRDGTVLRDRQMHHYVAERGYATVRVDMRGSGDSGGVLLDEYLAQEQDDALEVIAWLSRQPWCSGAVGMIGISWGGFNGLQVAARRPPALKAVVTVCSTDDRYADDCHFMGGCLLNNSIAWASTMFAFGSLPPDPDVVGDAWRGMWRERLDNIPLLAETWLSHQTRDAYWKHGSVCEDYRAIEAAVYAVGGWADGYSNAVPRLLANLSCPRKGLIGPWGHAYPHAAQPGPAIGFLQECVRWWDRWLKDKPNGIMDEPMLRAFMQDSVPPRSTYRERPGRWIAEEAWPPASGRERSFALAGMIQSGAAATTLRSPIATGVTFGEWCPYGLDGELPVDQRPDDGRSLVFDTPPLAERLEILGAPTATVALASDREAAQLALRLEDVDATGAATLVTYGILNLTHRAGHERAVPLVPGERITITVALNDIAHAFPPGHRIRLAVATGHWPAAWPAPAPACLTIWPGDSRLTLPERQPQPSDATLPPFLPPEQSEPEAHVLRKSGSRSRTVTEDPMSGGTTVAVQRERASYFLPEIDLEFEADSIEHYSVVEGDRDATRSETQSVWQLRRRDWRIRTETAISVTGDAHAFRIAASLKAYEDDRCVADRSWTRAVPRDGV